MVNFRRKRGQPKRTWRKQVEEERLKAGLNLKDAQNRNKWRESASNFHAVNSAASIKWGQHGMADNGIIINSLVKKICKTK